ncbi:uncharacterized protein [Eurosta solidaginis]|uniref:uncharacterized protein n=1 Tax=Eurosta solidaginis TaxID=178769 RepID=UPI003531680B
MPPKPGQMPPQHPMQQPFGGHEQHGLQPGYPLQQPRAPGGYLCQMMPPTQTEQALMPSQPPMPGQPPIPGRPGYNAPLYCIPATTDLLKTTALHFTRTISPIVNFGELGPTRCNRSKPYMSPNMQFVDAGCRFQYLMCKVTTKVPTEYFQHLDHTGQRVDKYERPELVLGTYEFLCKKCMGIDSLQGKPQLISNINACQSTVDAVHTILGPRAMDKLIVDFSGKATISNGATIIRLLNIVLPAAKTLVDIAKSQDAEVGDGTTSVVLLKQVKPYVEEGVHARIIIKALRKALQLYMTKINEMAVHVEAQSKEQQRALLDKCAATATSSTLIHEQKYFFSKMVVDTVLSFDGPKVIQKQFSLHDAIMIVRRTIKHDSVVAVQFPY